MVRMWLVAAALLPAMAGGEVAFVEKGAAKLVREVGAKWKQAEGALECGGVSNFLYAGKALGPGDFHVKARLAISGLKSSAASFVLEGHSHFGFDGRGGQFFVEGPLLGGSARMLKPNAGFLAEGKPFLFEAIRKGDEIVFLIDGKEAHRTPFKPTGDVSFGFRPWRSTMQISEFAAEGNLTDPPKPLEGQVEVFTSGTDGYHTYRIPAVIVTPKGTILAFCEGRKKSSSDTGDIDIVLKRSTDGGKTWGKMQVVADHGPHVIGNPCPVVDRSTGTIWMPLTRNRSDEPEGHIMKGTTSEPRTVWLTKSTDDGLTWSEPVNISDTTRKPHWRWYATGPGVGIQLKSGRMVIPCDNSDHSDPKKHPYGSHVIYSDDHGATWKLGGTITDKVNECQVAELADGTLMMNMRSYAGKHRRAVSTSNDGGLTWAPPALDEALVEPVCQASFLRYTLAETHGKNRLLFSNPASASRVNMTVRLSYDEGRTWPVAKTINPGPSAYSCLTVLPDMTIGCLYERGDRGAYEKITFARFPLDWLTDGADRIR
ncbi:MAG TPA: sialidase family protein [Planctomycetota bacterium]|nr:sialidase family protein [Planctomycetota bacterium]